MFWVLSHTIFALLLWKAIVDKSDREKFLPVQKCLSVEKHIYRMKNKFRRTRNIFAGREIFLSVEKYFYRMRNFWAGEKYFLPVENVSVGREYFVSIENAKISNGSRAADYGLGINTEHRIKQGLSGIKRRLRIK